MPAKKNLEINEAEKIILKSSIKIDLECDHQELKRIEKFGTKNTEKQQSMDFGSNASTIGESHRKNNGFDSISRLDQDILLKSISDRRYNKSPLESDDV